MSPVDDPELLNLAWTMLEQEWPLLEKMCRIAARKDRTKRNTWEEAMSEVAAKLPSVLWSYKPGAGRTLRSHVIGSMRWYLFKMFVSSRKRDDKRRESLFARHEANGHENGSRPELLDQDQVQYILDGVHPFHRSVLQLYYMSGLTCEEIGGVLECSKSTARRHVQAALKAAQEVVRDYDSAREGYVG